MKNNRNPHIYIDYCATIGYNTNRKPQKDEKQTVRRSHSLSAEVWIAQKDGKKTGS